MDSLSPLASFTPSRSSVDCKTREMAGWLVLSSGKWSSVRENPPLPRQQCLGPPTRESEEEMEGNANTIYRSFLLWLSYFIATVKGRFPVHRAGGKRLCSSDLRSCLSPPPPSPHFKNLLCVTALPGPRAPVSRATLYDGVSHLPYKGR